MPAPSGGGTPKLTIIGFRPAREPVRGLVTKLGGQPVWNGPPTWPLHQASGRPMEFVAQVHLDPAVFAIPRPTMVYLFVADAVEALTYEPYGGENAVVVQPGGPTQVDTVAQPEGPTLHHLVSEIGAPQPAHPAECELEPDVLVSVDAEAPDPDQRRRWAGDPWLEYIERAQGAMGTTRGNKIGGVPYFHRGWPAPFTADEWMLALQLDGELPFFLNLGLDGTGYVLVRRDLSTGVFFWERPG